MKPDTIASFLQRTLLEKGWTGGQLHRALLQHGVKVTRTSVNYWISGKRHPKIGYIAILGDVLELSAGQRQYLLSLALEKGISDVSTPPAFD